MPQATVPEDPEPAQEWSRGALLSLLLVLGVGVVLGWAVRGAALPVNGDDAIYLTLSRSLATGHYLDEYLVGAPPHAQYPPGMPAWLLLVRIAAGGSLDAALGANLLLVALTAALLADAVRRLSTPLLAVTAAAVVMWNPELLALAGQLRSEVPFLAACAATLWFSLVDGQRARRWYPAFTIAAALAAFLTRSAGIALIPAVGWALVLRRRWRPLITGGAVSVMVIVAWFAYTRWAGQHTIGHTYATDFAAVPPLHAPTRFLGHMLGNAKVYFASLASRQFGIPDVHNQPLDNVIFGMCLIIPALFGAWKLARQWPAMVVYLLLSALILLVFPYTESRLLTVHLPWLVAISLIGWAGIATVAGARDGDRIALSVAVILAGFGLAGQVKAAQREQRCRAKAPYVDPECYLVADRSYVAAAKFIRDSLPSGAVIAASKPSIVYHLTQRRTLPLDLFAMGDATRLLFPRGPATVVLLSRKFPYEAEVVAPRLRDVCSSLALLARFPEGTLLLGARHNAMNGLPDGCLALRQYLRDTPTSPDGDTQ